jgi:hypothetical protein
VRSFELGCFVVLARRVIARRGCVVVWRAARFLGQKNASKGGVSYLVDFFTRADGFYFGVSHRRVRECVTRVNNACVLSKYMFSIL